MIKTQNMQSSIKTIKLQQKIAIILLIVLLLVAIAIFEIGNKENNVPPLLSNVSDYKEESHKEVIDIPEKLIPNTKFHCEEYATELEYETLLLAFSGVKESDYLHEKIITKYSFKRERINSSSFCVIDINTTGDIGIITSIWKKIYIEDGTGKIRIIEGYKNDEKYLLKDDLASGAVDLLSFYSNTPYAYWMLSLNENFRWKMNVYKPEDKQNLSLEFDTLGVEKEQNRICFKVKISATSNINEKSIKMGSLLWIDKEKRILVKGRLYINNIPFTETIKNKKRSR